MFSMFGEIHTHLDDMLVSQYQSIDSTQHITCPYYLFSRSLSALSDDTSEAEEASKYSLFLFKF